MLSFRTCLCLLSGVIGGAATCAAQEPAPERVLTSISEIRSLPQAEAARAYSTHLQATVLFYDYRRKPDILIHELLIHDGTAGIFIYYAGEPLDLQPGEKIDLRGRTEPGKFAPIIKCDALSSLGPQGLPPARSVTLRDVLSGREDCQWVEMQGIVRRNFIAEDRREMILSVDGVRVPVSFAGAAGSWREFGELAEARVAIRGVVTGIFNEQGQMTGVRALFSPSLEFMRIVRPPGGDAFARPARTFDRLLPAAPGQTPEERVKVSGVVTHRWPGHAIFLSDGERGLMVKGAGWDQIAIGDKVEAVGFAEAGKYRAFLQDGSVRRTGAGALPAVRVVDAATALSGEQESSLVSFRAQFIERTQQAGEEVLLLSAGGTPFTARLHSNERALASALNGSLRAGVAVQVTGICTGEDLLNEFGKHSWQTGPMQILLRTPGDVTVISWWTSERLLLLVGAILTVLILSLSWVGALRRRVQAQTSIIHDQMQHTVTLEERNRIARELHDTLAQGFAGTAFALEGIATNLDAGDERIRPQIEMALRMVRHSLTEARRSVMNLRADALGNRDLASALDETARRLVAGHDIELRADIHPLAAPLPQNAENEIFRIAVEAITNALRHAKPRTIAIQLRDTGGNLLLRVRDDGVGFDAGASPVSGHFGLVGMRERAKQIGATFVIESAPNPGCEVYLTLKRPVSPS